MTRRIRWQLVAAGLLLAIVLYVNTEAQLLLSGLALMDDVDSPGNGLPLFWRLVGVGALIVLAFLALAIGGIARLAARGRGRFRVVFLGGVLGLASQFLALQVLLGQRGTPQGKAIASIAVATMQITVVAFPLLLIGREWTYADRE